MHMTKICYSGEPRSGVRLASRFIQMAMANILLENFPEHLRDKGGSGSTLPALVDSMPRYQ